MKRIVASHREHIEQDILGILAMLTPLTREGMRQEIQEHLTDAKADLNNGPPEQQENVVVEDAIALAEFALELIDKANKEEADLHG